MYLIQKSLIIGETSCLLVASLSIIVLIVVVVILQVGCGYVFVHGCGFDSTPCCGYCLATGCGHGWLWSWTYLNLLQVLAVHLRFDPVCELCAHCNILHCRLLSEKCGSVSVPECETLREDPERTVRLLHGAVWRARFRGADGRTFRFTGGETGGGGGSGSGAGPGTYRVLNYQINGQLTNTTGFHQV